MEQQKERPMLFSGAMVRAILDGRKTQTRRVMKTQPGPIPDGYSPRIYWPARDRHMALMHMDRATAQWERPGEYDGRHVLGSACGFTFPYGQPGDRLWVRENGWERPERTPKMMRDGADTWAPYYFDADGHSEQDMADFKAWGFKRRHSIHMPRSACRLVLEVTDVRVERLNDCSETDAIAEGLKPAPGGWWSGAEGHAAPSPQAAYALLWESINGAGSWAANPWVWVVEFKRL